MNLLNRKNPIRYLLLILSLLAFFVTNSNAEPSCSAKSLKKVRSTKFLALYNQKKYLEAAKFLEDYLEDNDCHSHFIDMENSFEDKEIASYLWAENDITKAYRMAGDYTTCYKRADSASYYGTNSSPSSYKYFETTYRYDPKNNDCNDVSEHPYFDSIQDAIYDNRNKCEKMRLKRYSPKIGKSCELPIKGEHLKMSFLNDKDKTVTMSLPIIDVLKSFATSQESGLDCIALVSVNMPKRVLMGDKDCSSYEECIERGSEDGEYPEDELQEVQQLIGISANTKANSNHIINNLLIDSRDAYLGENCGDGYDLSLYKDKNSGDLFRITGDYAFCGGSGRINVDVFFALKSKNIFSIDDGSTDLFLLREVNGYYECSKSISRRIVTKKKS